MSMGRLLLDAARAAAEFDEALSRVQAVLDMSPEAVEDLRARALDRAAQRGSSPVVELGRLSDMAVAAALRELGVPSTE